MRCFRFCIFLLIALLYDSAVAQKPHIAGMISQVSVDSLLLTVRQLSGDTAVVINGTTDTIKSRYANDPGNEKAAQFIRQKLESFGLTVNAQPFNGNGNNLYAIQAGTNFPDQFYMICAHYDNLPGTPVNYGADDNASGVAAVIEAARIFSRSALPYSIAYILFDQEEQGLLGSDHFCKLYDIGSKPVLGVINMDMIAYDGNQDSVANIHIRPVGGDSSISKAMINVNTVYHTGLNLTVIEPGSTNSDHASFWKYFMPAAMLIEDDKHDFNPAYHSLNDKINLFNNTYFHRMARLAIGTLAELASDSTHVGINEYTLQQQEATLYPNPVNNDYILINPIHAKSIQARITDSNGAKIYEELLIPENETLQVDLPYMASGLYHLMLLGEDGITYSRFIKK